jgi:hypothetical protein
MQNPSLFHPSIHPPDNTAVRIMKQTTFEMSDARHNVQTNTASVLTYNLNARSHLGVPLFHQTKEHHVYPAAATSTCLHMLLNSALTSITKISITPKDNVFSQMPTIPSIISSKILLGLALMMLIMPAHGVDVVAPTPGISTVPRPLERFRLAVGVLIAAFLMIGGQGCSMARSMLAPVMGATSVLFVMLRNDDAIKAEIAWM